MFHLITALEAEAKPLIEYYGLSRMNDADLFPIFCDKDAEISLTITGIGKTLSAAAIGYCHARCESQNDAWLNVGIAGNGQAKIGDAFLVNRVHDQDTGKSWYPAFVFDSPLPQKACTTVSHISDQYEDGLLDMEASAFMHVTSRFTTAELVHVLKIVSDNDKQSRAKVNKVLASELIQGHLDTIDKVMKNLMQLTEEYQALKSEPKFYAEFKHAWHFTKTQSNALYKLLQRWQLLRPEENPFQVFRQSTQAKTILLEMGNILDNSELRYDR